MRGFIIYITIILYFLLFPLSSFTQDLGAAIEKRDTINHKKFNTFLFTSIAAYGVALAGLNEIWYKDKPRESFHFFNDNQEWKQLDKFGHLYNTYQISRFGVHTFNKIGLPEKKAYFWGSMLGVIILTPIEILDGFSSEYGASWGDVVANISGAGLVYGQYMLWNELRVHSKYSFRPTSYAPLRPEVLGDGFHEEIIKDYNGMTFWFSFDIAEFLPKENRFPKWLNIAVGYGAKDMLYANDESNIASKHMLDPYRRYYMALDFDLSHIQSNSKVINTLLYAVNMIHLPAPAIEYNHKKGLIFHALQF